MIGHAMKILLLRNACPKEVFAKKDVSIKTIANMQDGKRNLNNQQSC